MASVEWSSDAERESVRRLISNYQLIEHDRISSTKNHFEIGAALTAIVVTVLHCWPLVRYLKHVLSLDGHLTAYGEIRMVWTAYALATACSLAISLTAVGLLALKFVQSLDRTNEKILAAVDRLDLRDSKGRDYYE